MRTVFCGTPDGAVPPLRSLVDAGYDVALVVTQPDRRRSRGPGADPSPVKRAAIALGLPVITPARAGDVVDEVRASGAQLGVVVAFGQLLPQSFLDALPGGFVNVHFSLLPRWRGAAPVERAILAGDRETGVCLMRIARELDAGPVYACARVAVGPDDTAGELRARLVAQGCELLLEHLPRIPTTTPTPQRGEVTYAEKLTVEEFRLDPRRSAAELARLVRAGNPRPGAWLVVAGRRVKVWRAHVHDASVDEDDGSGVERLGAVDAYARVVCAAGLLVLDEVQPEGGRPMPGPDWRRGVRGEAVVEPAADTARP